MFTLKYLGLAVPCFYGVLLFLYSSDDIKNPSTPVIFTLAKDLILFAIIIISIAKILTERKISRTICAYFITVILFTFYISSVNLFKDWAEVKNFTYVKHHFFYLSGVLYVYIYGKVFTENYLRKLLLLVVFLGYIFMMVPNLDQSIFMYDGRSISTLLNPNFLGYILSLVLILILFNLKNSTITENSVLLLSVIILVLTTESITSVFLVLLLLATFSTNLFYIEARIKYYSRAFLLITVATALLIIFQSESAFRDKVIYLSGFSQSSLEISTSLEGRLGSYSSTWFLLTDSGTTMFFGSNDAALFEWDSGLINVLYNYGVIGFLLWAPLFLIPIFSGLSSEDLKSKIFAIFILFSCALVYTSHYVNQFYPTNFLISIIIGLIIVKSDETIKNKIERE